MINPLASLATVTAQLEGRSDAVSAGAFSPDGKLLATAFNNGLLQLWDRSGRRKASFQADEVALQSVAFSPDSTWLATGASDGTIRRWDFDGKPLGTLIGQANAITELSFSSDGQYILALSFNNRAYLWDLAAQSIVSDFDTLGGTASAAFGAGGAVIVSANFRGGRSVYLVHVDNVLALAACTVTRPLSAEEIATFQVPTPLQFNFAARQCPPRYSWERPGD